MKGSVGIVWVVFFVVFSIIKSIAKKAEQSKANKHVPPSGGSNDPLQDFFNQLGNIKENKELTPKPEEKNVAEFYKAKPRVKNQKMTYVKSHKVKHKRRVDITDASEHVKMYRKALTREPMQTFEDESFVDTPDVISIFNGEEEAFEDRIVGEEGKVDSFGDKSSGKRKYGFADRQHLRKAIVWAEILDKPKALQ